MIGLTSEITEEVSFGRLGPPFTPLSPDEASIIKCTSREMVSVLRIHCQIPWCEFTYMVDISRTWSEKMKLIHQAGHKYFNKCTQ